MGLKMELNNVKIESLCASEMDQKKMSVDEFMLNVHKFHKNMREKIETYTAPDLSDYDKRIDLAKQKLDMLESEISLILDEVNLVASVAKELKNDLKSDVRRIETIVEDVETRVKEDSRENARDLKTAIDDIEEDMKELDERITDKIQKALENPLANMRKN